MTHTLVVNKHGVDMKLHYLEIVSHDVDAVCKAYELTHRIQFLEPDELLGGAKVCVLPDGTKVGVRGPLRDDEEPIVRPYWLVDNIEQVVATLELEGAQIAMPPMEIPGKGKFAIYILGTNHHGLWQL